MSNNLKQYQGTAVLEILEGADEYNKWIADQIKPFLIYPSLEIGSGIGNISFHLDEKKPLYLSDKDPQLIKRLKKKFYKNNYAHFFNYDIEKQCPFAYRNKFQSVFGINVLEHIKDDEKILINLKQAMVKNGKLILLVPAKKAAFTRLDKELGHFRRYEKSEIINKLKKAGYRIEKIYFFNFLGLISWVIRDKVQMSKMQFTSNQVSFFCLIIPILRIIESIIKIPVGISLIVVAKKIN
jgi:SAM-dependent methyltransferase